MSWGERSCLRPCRTPNTCSEQTCNVDCIGYVWDGKTKPDSKRSISDYWILDGRSRSYDLREEIKSWGGYWLPDHKCWAIDAIRKEELAYKVLKQAGLTLQYRNKG